MKYVHIIAMDPKTGEIETRATCACAEDSSPAECRGDEALVERLGIGVFHPTLRRNMVPDDGIDFLSALRFEFKHPSLMASDVIEGETVEPYTLPDMKEQSA